MNILHAHTDPNLLQRFKEMLGGSARADIAVGFFFISGRNENRDKGCRFRDFIITAKCFQTSQVQDKIKHKYNQTKDDYSLI